MNDEVQSTCSPRPPGPAGLARRALLAAGLAAPAVAALPAAAQAAPAAPAAAALAASSRAPGSLGTLAVRGADISFLLQEEAIGTTYSDGGRIKPVEKILDAHGATWVRLRIWVNPPTGYSTLQSALILGRRAKKRGLRLLIDLHYSDFWADPGKQVIPEGWPTDDLEKLATTVRHYTRAVVRAFAAQGTPADMIQIGNEVTSGMLFPLGQLYQADGQHWAEFATLVQAGLDGAAEGSPKGHTLRTMLHLDRGGDNGGSRWFFDKIFAQGIDVDVIGESYYSVWHGSLATLGANLTDLATAYDKDVLVAEVQYPWTTKNGDDLDNFFYDDSQLPDGTAYPGTPAGQLGFFNELREVIAAVPNGHGVGFLVWEPEWLPGVGWEPGAGTPNDNMTLFDFDGRALPAFDAFRKYQA